MKSTMTHKRPRASESQRRRSRERLAVVFSGSDSEPDVPLAKQSKPSARPHLSSPSSSATANADLPAELAAAYNSASSHNASPQHTRSGSDQPTPLVSARQPTPTPSLQRYRNLSFRRKQDLPNNSAGATSGMQDQIDNLKREVASMREQNEHAWSCMEGVLNTFMTNLPTVLRSIASEPALQDTGYADPTRMPPRKGVWESRGSGHSEGGYVLHGPARRTVSSYRSSTPYSRRFIPRPETAAGLSHPPEHQREIRLERLSWDRPDPTGSKPVPMPAPTETALSSRQPSPRPQQRKKRYPSLTQDWEDDYVQDATDR
ncbi:hypothetical protein MKEN_00014000 [Mycena kentingensis (nom. inval.)]|nr:hypothetical protein MKEN_00014000 [Mycena kentingensis (nom. inval.)]